MAYTLSQLRGAWGAGKAAAEKEMNRPPLVGKYFHSVKDGTVHWQGKILSEVHEHRYLVQLFSWLDGAATNQEIVKLDDMSDWRFYLTHREWVDAGDKVNQEQQEMLRRLWPCSSSE